MIIQIQLCSWVFIYYCCVRCWCCKRIIQWTSTCYEYWI